MAGRYYTIRQVAEGIDVCVRTLELWEQRGVVRFSRDARGRRYLNEAALAELKAWAGGPRVFPDQRWASPGRQPTRSRSSGLARGPKPSREVVRSRKSPLPLERGESGTSEQAPACQVQMPSSAERGRPDASWINSWLRFAQTLLPRADWPSVGVDVNAAEEHAVYQAVEEALGNATHYERSRVDFLKRLVEEVTQHALAPYRERKATEERHKWLEDVQQQLLCELRRRAAALGIKLDLSDEREAVEALQERLNGLPPESDASEAIRGVTEQILDGIDEDSENGHWNHIEDVNEDDTWV